MRIWVTVISVLMVLPLGSAYTLENGVEMGDFVTLRMELQRYDTSETVAVDTNYRLIVDYSRDIEGLIDGVLGMKIGQTKTINIPPEKGYRDRTHDLFNTSLQAHVYLINIDHNIRKEYRPQVGREVDHSITEQDKTSPLFTISLHTLTIICVLILTPLLRKIKRIYG